MMRGYTCAGQVAKAGVRIVGHAATVMTDVEPRLGGRSEAIARETGRALEARDTRTAADVRHLVHALTAVDTVIDQAVAVVVGAIAALVRCTGLRALDPTAEVGVAGLDTTAGALRVRLRTRADLALL